MCKGLMLALFVVFREGAAAAQSTATTVRQLVEIAGPTPRSPISVMRPSIRRAWDTMQGSINASRAEETQAWASGQTPLFCQDL